MAEEPKKEVEEEDSNLPFPMAPIVRVIKANLDEHKLVRRQVKEQMNLWLAKICAEVSKEMNKSPYPTVDVPLFKQAIQKYENVEELKKEILSKESTIIKKAKEFKEKYNAKSVQTWSGVTVRKMAEKIDMVEDYLLTYKLCCSFSHPSFTALIQSTKVTNKKTLFSFNPSFRGVIANLKGAIAYLFDVLGIHDRVFKLGMKERLSNIYEESMDIFNMNKYVS